MQLKYLCIFVTLSWASPVLADDLHLFCQGGGTAISMDPVVTTTKNAEGKSVMSETFVTRPSQYQDEASIEIVDGSGRIKMPRSLLPGFHGGKDGWFELKKLNIDDKEINASITVNFYTSSKLRINRLTGDIGLDGIDGNFSGQCKPFDPETQKPLF